MKWREFISLLGGAAASGAVYPVAARAQQRERMRRIGVLMNLTADDPQSSVRVAAFAQGLERLGRTLGDNVQIDYRWVAGNIDRSREFAAELVNLAPDLSPAWRGRAAMPPGSPFLNMESARNGWSCSNRLRCK